MNAISIHSVSLSLTRGMLIALRSTSQTLTRLILDDLALPDQLKPLGSLLLAFTTSAAATTGLHHFLHRNREQRARIELAIQIVMRMIESDPQYRDHLDRPEILLHALDSEIMPVLNAHMTEGEAKVAMKQLKRKICDDAMESHDIRSKRRRSSAPERSMPEGGDIVTDMSPQMVRLPSELRIDVADHEIDVAVSEADIQAQMLAEMDEEDSSVMESVEVEPETQRTPSSLNQEEVQAAKNSQDSPTPQPNPSSPREPSPATTPFQTQTPLKPSMATQPTSVPQFVTPPSPTSAKFRHTFHRSFHKEGELRVSSPTPVPSRNAIVSLGYGLYYSDRTLYLTPTASAESVPEKPTDDLRIIAPGVEDLGQGLALGVKRSKSSHLGRAASTAAVQRKAKELAPSAKVRRATEAGASTRVVEILDARPQLALGKYSTHGNNFKPRTTKYDVAKNQRGPQHTSAQGNDVPQEHHGDDDFPQQDTEESFTPTLAKAAAEAPKRKRGRPRKDATQASRPVTVHTPVQKHASPGHEPVTVVTTSKRRGRPRKTPVQAAPVQEDSDPGSDAPLRETPSLWVL